MSLDASVSMGGGTVEEVDVDTSLPSVEAGSSGAFLFRWKRLLGEGNVK
jgi:hypothetical protein